MYFDILGYNSLCWCPSTHSHMLCFQIGAVVLCLGACMGLCVNGVGGAPPSMPQVLRGSTAWCHFAFSGQLRFILVLFNSIWTPQTTSVLYMSGHTLCACLPRFGTYISHQLGFRLRSAWHGWKGCKIPSFLPGWEYVCCIAQSEEYPIAGSVINRSPRKHAAKKCSAKEGIPVP